MDLWRYYSCRHGPSADPTFANADYPRMRNVQIHTPLDWTANNFTFLLSTKHSNSQRVTTVQRRFHNSLSVMSMSKHVSRWRLAPVRQCRLRSLMLVSVGPKVRADDEHWKFFVSLKDIAEIVFAPCLELGHVLLLQTIIQDHIATFNMLFCDKALNAPLSKILFWTSMIVLVYVVCV